MKFGLKKSSLRIMGVSAALALVLTGCGAGQQTAKVGTVEDPVTLRFAWWGNDSRAKTTLEVIKDFEAANPTWLRSSMEYAISSKSANPKEAALFINYLVDSMDAATKIKSDRGMPANTELKAGITPLLKDTQQKEAAYLDRIAELKIEAPKPFPAGSSATLEVLNRYNTDVLFGKISPQDAAKGMISEVDQNLG
jgi:ABC-type glycerol-3-phosphate transport system substrate-binding protein